MAALLQFQTLLFPSLHRTFTPLSFSSQHKSLILPISALRSRLSLPLTVAATAQSFSNADYDDEEEDFNEPNYGEEDDEEPPQRSRRPGSSPQDAGRLYVGNLPFSMPSAQLAEIFAQAGNLESAEVVYDRFTERSRGFAFVTMATVEEAHEAIRMFDGSQIGGRMVKVNFPEVPRGGERELLGPRTRGASRGYADSPFKIYAGNLGWNLTSQGLHDAFSSQPGLLGAKIIYDRDTGRSRGFGFVSFASHEECQAAMEALNGVEIEGRPMRLSPAEGKSAAALSPDPRIAENSNSDSLETSLSY